MKIHDWFPPPDLNSQKPRTAAMTTTIISIEAIISFSRLLDVAPGGGGIGGAEGIEVEFSDVNMISRQTGCSNAANIRLQILTVLSRAPLCSISHHAQRFIDSVSKSINRVHKTGIVRETSPSWPMLKSLPAHFFIHFRFLESIYVSVVMQTWPKPLSTSCFRFFCGLCDFSAR